MLTLKHRLEYALSRLLSYFQYTCYEKISFCGSQEIEIYMKPEIFLGKIYGEKGTLEEKMSTRDTPGQTQRKQCT